MKKITLFILACTLVATRQTMLAAAGAAAMTPIQELRIAIFALNPAEVRRVLATHGAEALYTSEFGEGQRTNADFLSDDKILKEILEGPGAIVAAHIPAAQAQQLRDTTIRSWKEIQEIWQEYQKSLPARPIAVPAVAPR